MKLQLALDEFTLADALEFARPLADLVDLIEIGTPLVIGAGMRAVREFAAAFPTVELLSDEKIMDGGYVKARLGYDAGAEYVTVLGVTDILTIKGCLRAAEDTGKQLVVDMICVDDIPARISELEELGVHVLAVHTGADQQAAGRTALDDLALMKQHAAKAKVAVAGGITSATVADYVALRPDIVIVGSGITKAADPVAEAKAIRAAMEAAR